MKDIRYFTLTLWAALLLTYFVTGGRLLDWAFDLPELGQVDDLLIAAVDKGDQLKARFGFTDLFGDLRHLLHRILGV